MSRHRANAARAPWQAGTRDALTAAGLEPVWVRELVLRALAEDLGPNWVDVTTAATVPVDDDRKAVVVAAAGGVLSGGLVWPVVLAETAARLELPVPEVDLRVPDGAVVEAGEVLADVCGPTRALIVAERTALNLIRHLSGVASQAALWVAALSTTSTRLLDTRCTTPGLRPLERYAVRCGGGTNGRAGLFDAAHVGTEHAAAAGSIGAALDAVRHRLPGALVQVDVHTGEQALEAVRAGARFVVFQGMSIAEVTDVVIALRAAAPEPVEIAAAGRIDLDQAHAYAAAGVDYLYVDTLVQSSVAMEMTFVLS
jgi:nicotinate-nucleotide pyrophosphorylase (carboxylating)